MRPSRPLQLSLLLSLLVHLSALLYLDGFWEKKTIERFRTRLARRLQFIPPPHLPAPEAALPRVEMEYLRSEGAPGPVPAAFSLPLPPSAAPAPAPGRALEVGPRFKPSSPRLTRVSLPSPGGLGRFDTLGSAGMEILRMADMARADKERALVVPDLYSRRDIEGYINFTYLRMDGAGSYPGIILEDLARYIRDHTHILAQTRRQFQVYFLSAQLLKDPIHFLFPIERLGGSIQERRTYVGYEELMLLEKYVRGGGFLFVDAGKTAGDRRFLNEMVDMLHKITGGEGYIFEIPLSHPIYHSFFDFDSGFPGELKGFFDTVGSWDYPDLPPQDLDSGGLNRGLWGVQMGKRMVAVVSDLDLHTKWSTSAQTALLEKIAEQQNADLSADDTEQPTSEGDDSTQPDIVGVTTLPFLEAATNVVLYALTQPEGLAVKWPQPAWKAPRPAVPLEILEYDNGEGAVQDEEGFEEIGAGGL